MSSLTESIEIARNRIRQVNETISMSDTTAAITPSDWVSTNRLSNWTISTNDNTSSNQPLKAYEIKPFPRKRGEPQRYTPEKPIVYLNRAYMRCEFRHLYVPNIVYKFPRPYMDPKLYRKTDRIVLTFHVNHDWNIWGIDYKIEPTFQLSLPRNAFTLHLQR